MCNTKRCYLHLQPRLTAYENLYSAKVTPLRFHNEKAPGGDDIHPLNKCLVRE